MSKPTIGFIGLGLMGSNMVENLQARGFELMVYARNKDAVAAVLNRGHASEAASPRELAQRAGQVLAGREVRATLRAIEDAGATAVYIAVDITGTFSPGAGLRFVPVAPTRAIDTRNATGGWSPIHGADQTFDIRVTPPDARAVTGTLTIVNPLDGSFVSAEPCTGSSTTSSVNAGTGSVIANSVTVGVTDAGRLCLTASAAGHTLFDTTGWWVD